jgi:hypothetical protein
VSRDCDKAKYCNTIAKATKGRREACRSHALCWAFLLWATQAAQADEVRELDIDAGLHGLHHCYIAALVEELSSRLMTLVDASRLCGRLCELGPAFPLFRKSCGHGRKKSNRVWLADVVRLFGRGIVMPYARGKPRCASVRDAQCQPRRQIISEKIRLPICMHV